MIKKINYRYLSGVVALVTCSLSLLVSCDDYLNVVPTADITTIESTFETREAAHQWKETCYVFLTTYSAEIDSDPAFFGADEFCTGDHMRNKYTSSSQAFLIGDGLQGTQSPLLSVWHKNRYFAALRYCNIFLDNIMNVYNMAEEEKMLWRSEVEALKAYYYFDLMRRYGPIPLVNDNISANASSNEMQQSRRPITEVVDTIVSICDRAIANLPLRRDMTTDQYYYFSRESAATVKAMTLLYAASPLFNGSLAFESFTNRDGEQLFPAYDRERWHRAAVAADEALRIAESGHLTLISGTADRPNEILNTIGDIELTWGGYQYMNPEALMMVKNARNTLSTFIPPYRDPHPSLTPSINDTGGYACLGASMKMVEMFYTVHGLPISEDMQWVDSRYSLSKENNSNYQHIVPLGENILSLHRLREPRFYAIIGADRTYWYRYTLDKKYDDILIMNRRGEWGGTELNRIDESVKQNITGYWVKKWMFPSVPLQNYSGRSKPDITKVMFRLPDLLLASAEAWNEYLDQPDERVYGPLDQVRRRADILPVRDAWTNYAKNPQKCRTQAGMREIIQQEWNIEFAFESRRFWNLRRWMTAPEELNQPQYGWNVLASDEAGFYNNFEGPIPVWKKRSFTAPRDYFFPIRAEEIFISGVVQNPGW